MSNSLEDLEELHILSDNGLLSATGKGDQIVSVARESFIVRKPTKRRFLSAKLPLNSSFTQEIAQLKGRESINVVVNSPILSKRLDSHEDHHTSKSSLSITSPKMRHDRSDIFKDRVLMSGKNSKFKTLKLQNSSDKVSYGGSTSNLSAIKVEESLVFTPIKPTEEQVASLKDPNVPALSLAKIVEPRHLRAINDKAEYNQIESSYRHDPADHKLRGLLKKHAIKRKETYNMANVLKKLKVNRSRSIISKLLMHIRSYLRRGLKLLKSCLIKSSQPIDPQGLFTSVWFVILMTFIVYELMILPLELAFDLEFNSVIANVEWIENIVFFIDIIISFRTSWYKDGILVENPSHIAWCYIKSWFIVDVLCCFPFQFIFKQTFTLEEQSTITLFGFLRVLKIIRIAKLFKTREGMTKLKDHVRLSGGLNGVMRLLKLCFMIVFIAHWCACFWHLIGSHPDRHAESNWIETYGLNGTTVSRRYIKSLYWAIATLLTVGYGDVVATNVQEQIFAIFVMVLGSGIIGFSMNRIGDILQQINSEVNYREKKINELRKFMDRNEIDSKLQIKAKQYVEFKLEHERSMRESDLVILGSLSQSLRDQMLKQINGRVMKNNQLFQKCFGSSFLNKLAMMLEEELYAPEEYVFRENEDHDCSLYFLARGRVETCFERFRMSLHTFEKGSYFGEVSFFTGKHREISARTLSFSSVFCLSYEKFSEMLKGFSTDTEMYHMLKDKVNLYKDYSCIGAKCQLCDEEDHTFEVCPKTHLVVDRCKIISKHIEKKKTIEQKFPRQNRKRFHALQQITYVKQGVDRVHTGETMKEQQTTSFTEIELNLSGDQRSKRLKFLAQDDSDAEEGDDVAEALYKTLARVKDHETGVMRLMKKKSYENITERKDVRKSFTMKQNGEAVFIPFKIQIADEKPQVPEEIEIDQMRNYEIYFPHNNLTKVIEQYENIRVKKRALRINLGSQQDIAFFKMKLGKIFEKHKKKTSSELSAGEMTPINTRRKSMFYKKNPAHVLVRTRSRSMNQELMDEAAQKRGKKWMSATSRRSKEIPESK